MKQLYSRQILLLLLCDVLVILFCCSFNLNNFESGLKSVANSVVIENNSTNNYGSIRSITLLGMGNLSYY